MTKPRKLRAAAAALAAAVMISGVMPGLTGTDVLAVSQSQIDALEEQRDALRAEREEMQAGIDELESQQADVLAQKAALDAQNEVYRQEIELVEEQVSIYTQLVEDKAREVEQATADENEQLATYRRHVRAMEENGRFTYLSILFGSSSLGELMSNLDMIGEIMEADQRSYDQYVAAREKSEQIQAEYETMLDELDVRQAELESERAELEAQIEEATQLIVDLEAQLETDRAAYEEQLAKEEALESEIQNMIAELERQEAANSITSTGTYIWPLPGYSPGSAYGWRIHPIWGDRRFHAGEDIGAPSGTSILAADSGIATVIEQSGRAGEIKAVGFDTDEATLEAIEEGVLTGTISQGTEAMGFWAFQILFMVHNSLAIDHWQEYEFLPLPTQMDIGVTVVTAENIDLFR